MELPETGFDIFGGACRMKHLGKDKDKESLYDIIAGKGYGVAYGIDEYNSIKDASEKMLLVEKPELVAADALAYAIDRKGGELTLSEIVESAISFLSKDADKGFFLMIEGGKIDWSCHSNDGGTTIQEVLDFSAAIDKVVEFYNAHPDETLIVVTADHETGGFALGHKSGYELNTKAFNSQKISKELLSQQFRELAVSKRKLATSKPAKVEWSEVKEILTNNLGFWSDINITEAQEKELIATYEEAFVKGHNSEEKTLYATTGAMANLAMKMLNDIAKVGWTTGSHSGIPVPVYAKGAGSSKFDGKMDNTDIPKKIMSAAGLKF